MSSKQIHKGQGDNIINNTVLSINNRLLIVVLGIIVMVGIIIYILPYDSGSGEKSKTHDIVVEAEKNKKIEDFIKIIRIEKGKDDPIWYDNDEGDKWKFYSAKRFEGTYYGVGEYEVILNEFGDITIKIETPKYSDTFVILNYDSTGFKTDGNLKFIRL